jgi:hypothetical protein
MSFLSKMKSIIKVSYELVGVYVFWIILHNIAANLYPVYCANLSFMGLVISVFQTPTPQCVGLRWVITNGSNMINQMWSVLGTWLLAKIIQHNMLPTVPIQNTTNTTNATNATNAITPNIDDDNKKQITNNQ